jgi:carbon-monoxide dehydrogenase medium subunit
MKLGLAAFEHMIDLKGIDSLRGIRAGQDGSLVIGATVTHREIERSKLVAERFPVLPELERQVANVRVRNAGSLAGNVCFAEPHSDPATFLVCADALVRVEGINGSRTIAMRDFITGPLETARRPEEIVVSIDLPEVPAGSHFAYRKIAFKERPVASVAVRVDVVDGSITSGSVVVGSVSGRPTPIHGGTVPLLGVHATDHAAAIAEAAALAAEGCEAEGDLDVSEEYQRHLVRVLARRALGDAIARASGKRVA